MDSGYFNEYASRADTDNTYYAGRQIVRRGTPTSTDMGYRSPTPTSSRTSFDHISHAGHRRSPSFQDWGSGSPVWSCNNTPDTFIDDRAHTKQGLNQQPSNSVVNGLTQYYSPPCQRAYTHIPTHHRCYPAQNQPGVPSTVRTRSQRGDSRRQGQWLERGTLRRVDNNNKRTNTKTKTKINNPNYDSNDSYDSTHETAAKPKVKYGIFNAYR